MIRIWRITPTETMELKVPAASLDEVTRQLPDGYYSTFRTFDKCTRVLGFTSHLRRLYEPVSTPEVDESFLRRQLRELLELFCSREARVRIIMTKQGKAYVAVEPLRPLPPEVYENGVRVETTQLQREHPHMKSTTFIARSDPERKHIAQEGIFEALLVKDGSLLEGMTSNFFYLSRAADLPYLGTASDNILPGITREIVIDLARRKGLELKNQPLKKRQLATVEEAFITSSSRGIVPVIQIDETKIGQGRPGPITKEFMAAYDSYVMERAERL